MSVPVVGANPLCLPQKRLHNTLLTGVDIRVLVDIARMFQECLRVNWTALEAG